MSDFSVGAELDVRVPDRELRDARRKIEEELGDVSISVDAGAGNGSGGRMAGRERAMSRQLLTESNRLAKTSMALDEHRNNLLEQLVEETEEGNRNQARSGGGMAGAAIGIGAIGGIAAAGSGMLSGLLDFDGAFEKPDWLPPRFPEPPWTPIGVDVPDEIPVEDVDPLPVANPDWLPLEDPTGSGEPAGGGQPDPGSNPTPEPGGQPDPGAVGDPNNQPAPRDQPIRTPGTRPDANPEPAPRPEPDGTGGGSDGGFADIDPRDVLKGAGAAGLGAAGGKLLSDIVPRGGATGSPLGLPSPGAMIAQQADRAQDKSPDKRNRIEEKLLELLRRNGGGAQAMTFTADISNDISLDGVTEQQLQQQLQNMQSDILRQVNQELTGGGRVR